MTCLDRVLRLHALRLAVAAFVIAPSASALAADCAQWNVGGKHGLVQSNIRAGEMNLQQDGTLFKGYMSFLTLNSTGEHYNTTSGDIVGTAVGNKFEATVYWMDNRVGVYTGQIGPQGLVVGRTYNKNNPAESAEWHGSPAFDCLTKAAPNTGASNGNNGNNDNSGKPAMALGRVQLQPSIVEPQKGGVYPSQTPLRVRVAAGKGAKDAAYRIEIQRQRLSGTSSSSWNIEWLDVFTADTAAAVAQSPQGYREWGGTQAAAAGAEMTATGGLFRIRARATAPQASPPGDWVEFRIKGAPGTQNDANSQTTPGTQSAGSGAAPSAAPRTTGQPRTQNALANTPANAAQNKAQAVTLNPQPLPPKTSPGAATLDAQTLTPRTLGGAAALNPQPLPLKTSPAALAARPLNGGVRNTDAATPNPQALPAGGLQQAPSSLR